MCQAQKCPVCYGSGSVLRGDPYGMSTTGPVYQACHGCGGCGWVVVHCINDPKPEPMVRITIDGVPIEEIPGHESHSRMLGPSNTCYPVTHG